jgi:FKBP-type peptidyl-prolyl cis-trans isomerase 2
MAEVKNGDTVRVHYTGKLGDGTIFDSSTNRSPLEFKVGQGQVIQGFEEAVIGMNPGEAKTVKISVDQAYGPRRDDMITQIERNQIPPHIQLEVGLQLQVTSPGGQPAIVTVMDLSESSVTLDANHPLAGKDLTFEIELVEII